ncbi:hypothetical protein G7Y79_00037g073050 [Physcia stellaris]|nr:hypothetical protein G7Y79_00037g073050 [Physcia stellaris]
MSQTRLFLGAFAYPGDLLLATTLYQERVTKRVTESAVTAQLVPIRQDISTIKKNVSALTAHQQAMQSMD